MHCLVSHARTDVQTRQQRKRERRLDEIMVIVACATVVLHITESRTHSLVCWENVRAHWSYANTVNVHSTMRYNFRNGSRSPDTAAS